MIATPATGAPIGGQSVTLSGAAFGGVQKQVFVGGVPATVVSWTANAVVITTPRVPLTTTDAPITIPDMSLMCDYAYRLPLSARVELALIATMKTGTREMEHPCNFDYTAENQVLSLKGDPWADGRCATFPRVFISFIEAPFDNDTPYGSDKEDMTFMVVGCVKSDIPAGDDVTILGHMFVADVANLLCRDRGVGGVANDVRITQSEFLAADDSNTLEVNVLVHVEAQHFYMDHTKNQGDWS